ncbi:MAG: cytochrome c oxidase accessory protein CcoG [Planctomycetota bacterium]|nr:cytochrome c oxidase accessory protein CcoG [Planctomycetota bacterium]
MAGSSLLQPEERVLSTLNSDGSRRWLKPRLSPGRFLTARRGVAYFLLALFIAIPYIKMNGKPMILLDVVAREFTFFGKTFLPTDTLLLALLMVSIFLTIFFLTAVMGRVWCGWACPQTVYMEFVFRPIERFFEGAPGRALKPGANKGVRKALKLATFVVIALFMSHTFLAYFVGIDRLIHWVQGSPRDHWPSFLVVAITTGLILFDFGFFREQMCIVACPYGRFQSVMLDRNSLIISYDKLRGEPRGKKKREADLALPVLNAAAVQPVGDCIDCSMCVTTCPTGIDIRKGLQLECIGCAQCIDACDSVMTKLGRATGLIRYSSQNAVEKKPSRILRPRVVLYPIALTIALSAFTYLLINAKTADVSVLHGKGMPFSVLPSGEVANPLLVKVTNRTNTERSYTITLEGIAGVQMDIAQNPLVIPKGQMRETPFLVKLPPETFATGKKVITVVVTDDAGDVQKLNYRVLGPTGVAGASAPTSSAKVTTPGERAQSAAANAEATTGNAAQGGQKP